MQTKVDFLYGSNGDILKEIDRQRSSGWMVRSMTPASEDVNGLDEYGSATRCITSWCVVYEIRDRS